MFNFFFTPKMHSGSATSYGFRGRYFSHFDVMGKGAVTNSKFLSSLPGGKIRHIAYSVFDIRVACQAVERRWAGWENSWGFFLQKQRKIARFNLGWTL
jgi:hypothetical protein